MKNDVFDGVTQKRLKNNNNKANMSIFWYHNSLSSWDCYSTVNYVLIIYHCYLHD